MKRMVTILLVLCFLVGIGVIYCYYGPSIKLNGKEKVQLDIDRIYVEEGAYFQVFGKKKNDVIKIEGLVDTKKPGIYKIHYSLKKGIITFKKERIVQVLDKVKPTIELEGSDKVLVCPNKKYEEAGYKAFDNLDGDITNKVERFELKDRIVYKVLDSSNNSTVKERFIEYIDDFKPKINLKGDSTFYVVKGNKYTELGFEAIDNCDGFITDKVSIKSNVNTNSVGTYNIEYSVTDSSGNVTAVNRRIIVTDKYVDNTIVKNGTIYLTFDDGPSNVTSKVLDILKNRGVKATFFVLDKSSSLDYLIKREYNEGHTVALHSASHDYKQIYSSETAYFNDLNKIKNKVKTLTGVESNIIRFPGGSSNTVSRNYNKGIMTRLAKEVVNRGYHYFDWNVGSGDTAKIGSDKIVSNVTKSFSKSRINVVLMHDYQNNTQTVDALDRIISYGIANGYNFSAIDYTTPMVKHNIAN